MKNSLKDEDDDDMEITGTPSTDPDVGPADIDIVGRKTERVRNPCFHEADEIKNKEALSSPITHLSEAGVG
jgi:hypothetical protein